MLTNLMETGKVCQTILYFQFILCSTYSKFIVDLSLLQKKCAKYWPDKDKHLSMGRCRVYLSDETIYAFHVVRKLTVERVDVSIVQNNLPEWRHNSQVFISH